MQNMTKKLEGKVALVTGASKGIGQGLALGLAQAGANVAINFKTDSKGADSAKQKIINAGGTAESFYADIGSKIEFEELIEKVCEKLGRIDILVNNAARTRFGSVFEVTEEDFNDVIDTILRGSFFGSLAAARKMIEKDGGSIINISSISVKQIMHYHSAYTMAKGGLESLTRQLALELAPKIRVNSIAPTATITDRNIKYDIEFEKKWSHVTPFNKVASVSDYVGTCVFLASEDSAMITGQIICVDGGWTLQGYSPDMSNFDVSHDRNK